MKRWYVIQIKIKQEKIAIENLNAQGFQNFNPVYIKQVIIRGQKKDVPMSLFGGYMFVQFDIKKDQWKSIAHTQGIYKLLTAREHFCEALPKGFVEELIKRSDSNGILQENKIVKIFRDFHIGEEVQITNGPFKDFKGVIQCIEKNKIVILFCLLNGKSSVRLSKNEIKHAK